MIRSGIEGGGGLQAFGRQATLPLSYTGPDMAADSLFTTVSSKGQVILPKAIRDQLHWEAGTRLVVEHTVDGVLLRPITTAFAPTRPEDVFGCLQYKGSPKSIAEMDAGIATEAKRRHARGRY